MTHTIVLQSNNPLRDVWSVPQPKEHYSVQLSEPLMKADGIYATADIWNVLVTLQAVGLVDWARKKSFDMLWTYLSSSVRALRHKPLTSITITSGTDERSVKVEIVGLTPELAKQAEVSVRRAITDSRTDEDVHIRIGP